MDDRLRPELIQKIEDQYSLLRDEYAQRQSTKRYITINEARTKGMKTEWEKAEITKPTFLGNKVFEDFDLNNIRKSIDWSPFFLMWELKGKYPNIFNLFIITITIYIALNILPI